MRAALITLPIDDDGGSPVIAGKSVCERQVEFALRSGCELVILHGGGASPEAIALRHQVERSGARLQVVTSSHALVGALGDQDSLLVMQPGLLLQAIPALEELSMSDRMLVLSAGPGTQAGFERIDLDRAWAGVLTMPGGWLRRLETLPEDIAPAPALLRIALQQQLPEQRLADELLDSGDWQIVSSAQSAAAQEKYWVRKVLGEGKRGAFSRLLARIALRVIGGRIVGDGRVMAGSVLLVALLFAGGLVAGWFGYGAISFAVLALAVPVAEFAIGLARLDAAPFRDAGRWSVLRRACDLALVVCAVLAIDGLWYRELFAPVVLGTGLLLLDRRALHPLAEPIRDRGVVALIAAIGVMMLPPEQVLAMLAFAVLATNLAPVAKQSG